MITPEPEESPWWTLGRRLGLPVWGLGGDFNLMGGQPLLPNLRPALLGTPYSLTMRAGMTGSEQVLKS